MYKILSNIYKTKQSIVIFDMRTCLANHQLHEQKNGKNVKLRCGADKIELHSVFLSPRNVVRAAPSTDSPKKHVSKEITTNLVLPLKASVSQGTINSVRYQSVYGGSVVLSHLNFCDRERAGARSTRTSKWRDEANRMAEDRRRRVAWRASGTNRG